MESLLSIVDGLNFIEKHFLDDNSIWPKLIAYGKNWHIPVETREQALSAFYKAKLQDCRICPYPDFVEDYSKPDAREAMIYDCIGIVPNFLFIDLDRGRFRGTLDAYADKKIESVLQETLDRINEKFHGEFYPTVIWTGNGFHIYLPVQLSGPSWCLGHTDVFMNLTKTPDRDFLGWAEYYLSNGYADPAHYTTTSFKNMYCRVPGSINSKNGEYVDIVQEWDGRRPYINYILRDFYDHLMEEKKKPKPPGDYTFRGYSTKWN